MIGLSEANISKILALFLCVLQQTQMQEHNYAATYEIPTPARSITLHLRTNLTSHVDAQFELLQKGIDDIKSNQEIELKLQTLQREVDDMKTKLESESKLELLLKSIVDLKTNEGITPKSEKVEEAVDNVKSNQQLESELSTLKSDLENIKSTQADLVEQLKLLAQTLKPTIEGTNKPKVKEILECDKNLGLPSKNDYDIAPTNCQEAAEMGQVTSDAAYAIKLSSAEYFCAYCHYAESGSWLLIQRRRDGERENFYRSWQDYKAGFGNVFGEFWLGLERIHQITKHGNYELWVLLRDFGGRERNAYYKKFQIADENDKYKLTVSDYSGDAGDSLAYHNGNMFTTYDNDNDEWEGNCAAEHKGGWWYTSCYQTNLNGIFSSVGTEHGIHWLDWLQITDPIAYVHLAIRPAK